MSHELITPHAPSLSPRRVILPQEIISHISTFLDHPSTVAFGAACRSLREMVILAIWAEVSLTLPEHYGRTTDPNRDYNVDNCSSEDIKQAAGKRAEAIGEMVKDVLSSGNRKKWAAVEVLRLSPGPESIQAMMVLLDLVSRNVRKIEINPHALSMYRNTDHNSLDFRLIISGVTLPSLTTLRLGELAVRYPKFIPHLFVMAPDLTALDIHVDQTWDEDWDTPELPSFPTFEVDTKLEILRLDLAAQPDLIEEFDWDEYHVCPSVLALIKRSPQLRQMCFNSTVESFELYIADDILSALNGSPHLEDLYWEGESKELLSFSDERQSGRYDPLPKLLRVALRMERFEDIFKHIPQFMQCERLFFIPTEDADIRSAISPEAPASSPQRMTPAFARGIWRACSLRVIHIVPESIRPGLGVFERLDAIEAKGEFTGLVRSFRQEMDRAHLLHVRLNLDRIELSDESVTGERVQPEKRQLCHYTDYKGHIVPLELIEEMRVIQGTSEEEWDRRGVEVVDEAWKVLEDWYKTMPRIKGR